MSLVTEGPTLTYDQQMDSINSTAMLKNWFDKYGHKDPLWGSRTAYDTLNAQIRIANIGHTKKTVLSSDLWDAGARSSVPSDDRSVIAVYGVTTRKLVHPECDKKACTDCMHAWPCFNLVFP